MFVLNASSKKSVKHTDPRRHSRHHASLDEIFYFMTYFLALPICAINIMLEEPLPPRVQINSDFTDPLSGAQIQPL